VHGHDGGGHEAHGRSQEVAADGREGGRHLCAPGGFRKQPDRHECKCHQVPRPGSYKTLLQNLKSPTLHTLLARLINVFSITYLGWPLSSI
jgi:hypothetical protein